MTYKRAPTKLGSVGDPMSELNIQRRFNWMRELGHVLYVFQDMVNKDPAVRRALEELDYVQLERPRVQKE